MMVNLKKVWQGFENQEFLIGCQSFELKLKNDIESKDDSVT